jgi:hypothetical protein
VIKLTRTGCYRIRWLPFSKSKQLNRIMHINSQKPGTLSFQPFTVLLAGEVLDRKDSGCVPAASTDSDNRCHRDAPSLYRDEACRCQTTHWWTAVGPSSYELPRPPQTPQTASDHRFMISICKYQNQSKNRKCWDRRYRYFRINPHNTTWKRSAYTYGSIYVAKFKWQCNLELHYAFDNSLCNFIM